MTYGIQLLHTDGTTVLLEMSDRTLRLAENPVDITVPSSGTVSVSVTPVANTGNAIAVTENGAVAQVSSTGSVTVYGESAVSGSTKLRVYLY